MKLSIWQQFSSNHSGDFHIVAKFTTAKQADEAGQQLQYILNQLESFYGNTENTIYDLRPNKVEQEIAKQYDIEILTAIDWVFDNAQQRAFRVIDNTILLSSLYQQVHSGIPNPFPELLKILSADVVTRTTYGGCLITIEFDTPSLDSAKKIEEQVKTYHQKILDRTPPHFPPWIAYYLEQYDSELEQLISHWESTNRRINQRESELLEDIDNQSKLEKHDEWLNQQIKSDKTNVILQNHLNIPSSNRHKHPLLDKIMQANNDIGFLSGYVFKNCTEIMRDKTHVKLYRLSFGSPGCGLEAVIAWASAQHFTNISYSWELADDCVSPKDNTE